MFQVSLAALEDVTGVLVTNGACAVALVATTLSLDEGIRVVNNLVAALHLRDVA